MEIRVVSASDIPELQKLFYSTVRTVNRRDYTHEQIEAWSAKAFDLDHWQKVLNEQEIFVCVEGEQILGFASLTHDGYIDYLYVHKDFQGIGVASRLLKYVEEKAKAFDVKQLWSDVSITAKPFFLRRGFVVREEYTKQMGNLTFLNTIMVKDLPGERQ